MGERVSGGIGGLNGGLGVAVSWGGGGEGGGGNGPLGRERSSLPPNSRSDIVVE